MTKTQIENEFEAVETFKRASSNEGVTTTIDLAVLVDHNLPVPVPSDISIVRFDAGLESLVLVYSYADKYFTKQKAVKKTLTIPSWLNAKAESIGVNFSQVLQEALITNLGL